MYIYIRAYIRPHLGHKPVVVFKVSMPVCTNNLHANVATNELRNSNAALFRCLLEK